jgi:hypothetical protein
MSVHHSDTNQSNEYASTKSCLLRLHIFLLLSLSLLRLISSSQRVLPAPHFACASATALRARTCRRIPTLRRTFTGREARKHTHALPGQVRVGNSNELEQGGAHGTFTRQDGLASCTIVRGRVGNWLRWLVEWFVATIVLVTCSVD